MFETFENEVLAQHGKIPRTIILAWPHKNFEKQVHKPHASYVTDFLKMAKEKYPETRFFLADGLLEQKALARASDTAKTRYTKKQKWSLSQKFQTQTLPPLKGSTVIALDDTAETGSTFVEFINMLNHNGAFVAMAAVPSTTTTVHLHFTDKRELDARMKELDKYFVLSAKAAGVKLDPGEGLGYIERALNKKGHSFKTMTPGELQEMTEDFDRKKTRVNFFELLDDLGGKMPKNLKFIPR